MFGSDFSLHMHAQFPTMRDLIGARGQEPEVRGSEASRDLLMSNSPLRASEGPGSEALEPQREPLSSPWDSLALLQPKRSFETKNRK